MKEYKLIKIFWSSILESFTGKLWKWLVGGIGSLLGVLQFGKNFFEQTIQTSILFGIGILAVLLFLRFILYFCKNLIKHFHYKFRESHYGDAIILLKDSFAKVHAIRKKETIDDGEFGEAMLSICNNLKEIFDNKSGSICSVSIKVPLSGPVREAATVRNLCRDSMHMKIRDTDSYKKAKHSIIGNTPYQRIFNNILKGNKKNFYYLNQNIESSSDYENTSKDVYLDGILPYKSELVYPIIPNVNDANGDYDCLGFICIDCKKINSFDEKYDVAIIEGVADGVYDLIFARNLQKEKEQVATKKKRKDEQVA